MHLLWTNWGTRFIVFGTLEEIKCSLRVLDGVVALFDEVADAELQKCVI